jgi:hypothetical protein
MTDPIDDDDFWRRWPGFENEPTPQAQRRPHHVAGKPVNHRCLLPGGEVVFCFGTLMQDDELLVPMIVFHRTIVIILPTNSLIERWCGDEGWARDWAIVYGPPAGTDTTWLAEHPYFERAA